MARIFKHDGCYMYNRCLRRDDIMRSRRENNIWRHIVMIEASMEAFNFQFRSHTGMEAFIWPINTCMEAFIWSINSSNTYTIMEAFNCDWTWRHNTMKASSIDQIKKGSLQIIRWKGEMFTRTTSQVRSEPRLYPSWRQTQHGGTRGSWTNTDKRCRLHWRLWED